VRNRRATPIWGGFPKWGYFFCSARACELCGYEPTREAAMAAFLVFRSDSDSVLGEVPMGKDDPRSSPGFDRWLKANAVVGSILAIGMLAMALAGLYSPPPDRVTEFSSIVRK
jgi:hypothetical protein